MRRKILWLCSWYPGRIEPFNGDFIQRHAQAAAIFNDIHVIHVFGDGTGRILQAARDIQRHDHLTEQLVYYPRKRGALGRLRNGYLWLSLFRSAVKQYVRQQGIPDLVHVHIPMKAGFFGHWLKKKFNIPFVISEHWGIYNEIVPDNYLRKSPAFRRYSRRFFGSADLAISPSRFLAEGVDRLVVKKQWEIIPNVVNTGFFHYEEPTGKRPFRFIHVSNMVPVKNAEGILRAFGLLVTRHPEAELRMVGGRPESLFTLARELGIADKVLFPGEMPYSQVADEMKKADALILFSHIENSPCVIGEALCCGLPVIATKTGGIPELLDETNGRLVAPGDVEGLAEVMYALIGSYQEFDRRGIASSAANRFSYPVIGQQFREVYEALLTKTVAS